MADIKKIKVGDTTYDIRDATAARSTHNHDNVYVKYSAAQSLNDAQKKQARDNISAVSTNKDETISGLKTFAAPSNQSGKEQATVWFNTANGGRVGFGKEGENSGTGIFFDQESGTRRLNFRASSTAGAMVWSQPESGSRLYYDVGGVSFRQCSAISFDRFKSAGYLYTDSSGNLQKGSLAKVATSGSYSDLSNKPTIPTVNNATLTIQKNGTTIDTFTANSSTNKTVNITVPTGAAASKGVDTSISAASTSANLPTSAAVAAFVEGKGYASSSHTHGVSGHAAAGAHTASVTGASYTPAGSVTVTPNTTAVNSITAVGSLPSLTYENSTVKSVTEFSAGSVPSRSSFTYATGAFTNTAKALTGVKASGTDTFLKTINSGSGSLAAYDAATAGNVTVANGNRIPVVTGVTLNGASASSTENAAPHSHTHSITVSGTTGKNSNFDTTETVLTDITSGTTDVLTGVKVTAQPTVSLTANAATATGRIKYVESISGGSGSLSAYDAATNGTVKVSNGTRIPFITDASHTAASLGDPSTADVGSSGHTHDYTKPTGVSLGSNTTASGGVQYIENVTHTAASLTGTTKFNTDAIKSVTLSASDTSTDGPAYVASISGSAPSLGGTKTFVTGVTQGSGSLIAYDAATNGTAKVSNGTRVPFITSLSKGYTPAGTVTLENGTAPSMDSATTKYLSASFSGSATNTGSASTSTTSSAGSGTADQATGSTTPTFTGTATYSGNPLIVSGGNSEAVTNTGDPSSTTTVIKGTYSEGILSLTTIPVASSNHIHNYTHCHSVTAAGTVSSHTHTYTKPDAHTHTLSHTHSVTAKGSVTLTANPSNATGRITYVEAQGAFSAGTFPSASFSGTENTSVVTGGTTHYLAHSHTSAQSSGTGTVSISGGSYSATTKYMKAAGTAASTDTVGISGGSISTTTKYFHPSITTETTNTGTPSATTSVVTGYPSFSGGSASHTKHYLAHGHTGAGATTKYLSASASGTAVGGDGTIAAITGFTKTAIAIPVGDHTHTYGSSTALTTGASSGSAVTAVTGINGGSLNVTTNYLAHTHTGASANSTASAVTGVAANGTATVPTALTTATAYSITSVGSAPSLTTEDKELSKISEWSAGTLPTKGSNQTVVTGIKSSSFSGTAATITPTVTVTGNSITTDGDTE